VGALTQTLLDLDLIDEEPLPYEKEVPRKQDAE